MMILPSRSIVAAATQKRFDDTETALRATFSHLVETSPTMYATPFPCTYSFELRVACHPFEGICSASHSLDVEEDC